MRALSLALALLLAACAVNTLRTHALVVVSASSIVTDIGNAIQADSDAAFDAARDLEQKAQVYATWHPLAEKYARVKAALMAYERAIARADQMGDRSLVQAPARQLATEWLQLAALGDAHGVRLIGPPDALTKLAGAP